MKSKPKAKAKAKTKAPAPTRARKLKPDAASWGSARVHTADVDMETAVLMQECGYRVESSSGSRAVMYGDSAALARWQALGGARNV